MPKLSALLVLNATINDLQALSILKFVIENGDNVFKDKLDHNVDQFIEEAVNELTGKSN